MTGRLAQPSLAQLTAALNDMEAVADAQGDVFTLVESRLLESRLRTLMVPSERPVDGPIGGRTVVIDGPGPSGVVV